MNAITTTTTNNGAFSNAARSLSPTTKFVGAGAVAATIALFQSWVSVTDSDGISYSTSLSQDSAHVVFLAGLAAAVWAAWPALSGSLSKRRCVALTVAAAYVSGLAVLAFWQIHQVNAAIAQAGAASIDGIDVVEVGPAVGLLLYTAGAIAVCVGVVCAWRGALARRTTSCPFPPPQSPAVSFGA